MQNKLKQGEALFAEGEIEEAEKCFLELLNENPEDTEVLNNLGVISHTKGNFEKAEDYLLKALAVKKDHLDALQNLADLYQSAKRWKEASVQLEQYMAINDQDPNLCNQLGVVYLEMGDTEKARIALEKSLELNPDQETVRDSLKVLEKKTSPSMDCKREIEKGKTLVAEGKIEEAEKCFLEIVKHDSKNAEAYSNLGIISFKRQDFEQALDYFTKALEIDPFHKDAILNYSALLKNTNRFFESTFILEKAIKRFPDDQEISRLLSEIRQTRRSGTKIAVLCLPGLQSFLGDIVDYLKTKYDVRTCYSNNNQEIESAVKWADIVWLEWANELAVHVTNNMRCLEKKRVICRVHRYEVFSHFFSKIHWGIVDTTTFVARFMSVLSQRVVPDLDKKTNIRVLYNGVNLEKFKFRENAPGFNLAVVGYIHSRKNPTFWPLVLSKLVEIDKRYTLHIAGEYQQAECKLYLEHIINNLGIGDNIRFYGHQDNIHSWLEDKNYLLSTSIHESFGYTIAEAMAMGIKPLIHRFPGSEELWPHHCLFNSIDEVIEMIHKKDNYNSLEYYEFVEQKYSLQSQLEKIKRIIEETVDGLSGEAPSTGSRCRIAIQEQCAGVPTALAEYHRPEKNVIVTGIPRSGTSLFSVLLNTFENAVCLNEILYDVTSLPRDFAEIRRRLIAGEAIPNRYDSSGNLSTDTQGGAVNVENTVVREVDEHAVIGSKVNIPYLNQIQKILNYGYKVIAIVRDPVYAIGSWNSKKAKIIPEAHVTDDDMHPRWRGFSFASKDKIERQAQIWNFYAHLIWNLKDKIKTYTYELLTSDPEWVIQDVSKFLGLVSPRKIVELKNQNIDSKYPKIARIKEAVKKYCALKDVFGYSYLDYEEPSELQESCGVRCHTKKEQTAWSHDINYSRKAILTEKGSDPSHLIIAFGGIAQQLYLPPFEFFRATNSLSYSRILVRDFNQGWYHLGVDEDLATFDAVLKRLREIIEELSPETICTMGTSAGGYAALVFGHYLKADCVHALAPQTFINAENRGKVGERRWEPQIKNLYRNQPKTSWFYDLRNLLKNYNGKTVYTLHISDIHTLDKAYAEYIQDLPEIKINKYPCRTHNVGRHLKNNGLLANLLQKPVNPKASIVATGSS